MTILSAAVILKDGNDSKSMERQFVELGFEVQTISPNVLLLIADIAIFEKSFDSKVTVGDEGAFIAATDGETRHLPTHALPAGLAAAIAEAEFESPPEYDPASF